MSKDLPPPRHPGAQPATIPDAAGLEQFLDPDDHGLSLDELSQAYAALLARGGDPYSEPGHEPSNAPPIPPQPAAEESTDPANPQADEADCPLTPRTILEAILFVGHPAGEPLTSQQIAGLMRGVRPAEIDELVDELNDEYASLGAPYVIVSSGAGYRMVLHPYFEGLKSTFFGRIKEAKLSQAAIDVLAIVAYQQPVTAEVVDQLRGKPSSAILAQLVRRNLLALQRPSKREEKPTYRTTDRFLDLFGLDSLAELPKSHESDDFT